MRYVKTLQQHATTQCVVDCCLHLILTLTSNPNPPVKLHNRVSTYQVHAVTCVSVNTRVLCLSNIQFETPCATVRNHVTDH